MTDHDQSGVQSGDRDEKKIVIVEDEEILLELLKNKLEGAGFSVDVARDGLIGFDLIKRVHPDLVLLDMMLPGLTGFGVLEKMKEAGLLPATPVLIISNSGQPVETERAVALGVRDYMIKVNFDPNEVLMRVQALLEAEKNRAGIAARDPSSASSATGTVLIVEDDSLLQELLEQSFVQGGYRVLKAHDAEEARRLLTTETPDAILLDLVLPGMNGIAFLEELKQNQHTRSIPVVIISNLGQREEIEKGLALGAADYVVKAHISPGEIMRKVGALIKNPKEQAASSK